jgi:hypothetical protein
VKFAIYLALLSHQLVLLQQHHQVWKSWRVQLVYFTESQVPIIALSSWLTQALPFFNELS